METILRYAVGYDTANATQISITQMQKKDSVMFYTSVRDTNGNTLSNGSSTTQKYANILFARKLKEYNATEEKVN